MGDELKRRLFDVDEYHRMAEVGILKREDRVELIDGEIIEMTPIGAPHICCVMFLTDIFVRRLQGRAMVSPQSSVRLHRRTEPEPDIALLRPPLARYRKAIPAADDVFLVVEVADTSQYRDRVVKLPRYAAAAIPEVWIVDVDASVVEVHRRPLATGYGDVRTARRGDRVAPEAFPDVILSVDEILGGPDRADELS
jgi:Uma2 family endonuclease